MSRVLTSMNCAALKKSRSHPSPPSSLLGFRLSTLSTSLILVTQTVLGNRQKRGASKEPNHKIWPVSKPLEWLVAIFPKCLTRNHIVMADRDERRDERRDRGEVSDKVKYGRMRPDVVPNMWCNDQS